MTTEADTKWKRDFGRRFKIAFSFLLEHDRITIWMATTKICNVDNPSIAYPHAVCNVDKAHCICKIEDDWILAYRILKEDNQVKFVGFYK